ncbi:unnamed protein product, partial [Choristocarpus tenellus]
PFEAVENNVNGIAAAIRDFLGVNLDPASSPNRQTEARINLAVDDMAAIFVVLSSDCLPENSTLLLLLQVLKVLLRKQVNRKAMGKQGVQAVTNLLKSITCECANVILNMCYDRENVDLFLEVDGVRALVPLINSKDEKMQASGLGALQSVCFERAGREVARADVGVIRRVVRLLVSSSPKVRARALGAVHNLSTDPGLIGVIREEGGLAPLVGMLRHPEPQMCGGAAGTIQNLSREMQSRDQLAALGVVGPLSDLLVGRHLKSQV